MTVPQSDLPISERTAPSTPKLSFAKSINWRIGKLDIPLSKVAAAAEVDRATLTHFLAGRVTMRSDAIERLLVVLHMGITFEQKWQPPESLQHEPPGPAPSAPKKKRRSRPNNKPRG